MRPAIFFDRDGTLNEEVGYAGHPRDFHIYPFAAAAVGRVNRAAWAAVVVTNQAGVARGFYPESAVNELHGILRVHLAEHGATLDGVYYCPHGPDFACDCRKPLPGMAHRAARELDLDLARSWVIGDRYYDMGLAHAVGARGAMVRTGYGEREMSNPPAPGMEPDVIVADALAAVEHILESAAGSGAERP